MKKVLLAIAAVATITSCSQNEEFENPSQQAEIKIGTTAVTRATVMKLMILEHLEHLVMLLIVVVNMELLQQELKFLMEPLTVPMEFHGV